MQGIASFSGVEMEMREAQTTKYNGAMFWSL